jgi:hypothetical protein
MSIGRYRVAVSFGSASHGVGYMVKKRLVMIGAKLVNLRVELKAAGMQELRAASKVLREMISEVARGVSFAEPE